MGDASANRSAADWNAVNFYETGNLRPTLVFLAMFAAYLASIAAIGLISSIPGKMLLGALLCFFAGKLFVIGHDACHGSFTRKRILSGIIGRAALSSSFHVFTAWRYWHNVVHHGSTNNLDKDFVWRPLSKREFDRASRVDRILERLFRHHSGIGLGIYYLLRILLPKMLTVSRPACRIPGATPRRDLTLFYAFQVALLSWLVVSAVQLNEQPNGLILAANLLCGIAGPMIYVCYAIGFVVYFNHTHPSIDWFIGAAHGSFHERQTESTLYLRFQGLSAWLLPSEIMGHVAHHLDTRIPVRRLQDAQKRLSLLSTVPIKIDLWSWNAQRTIMRTCKLYDPLRQKWTGFDGHELDDQEKRRCQRGG